MKHKRDGLSRMLFLLIIAAVVFGSIFTTFLILIASGHVNISANCFAVDSVGDVYVGGTGEISVYSQGHEIRKFGSPLARSYTFTIDDNDVLWVSTGSKVSAQ